MCSRVRPSPMSSNVHVTSAAPASGAPSKISVLTSFSFGTISWYSPWKATSKPPSATIT